MKKANEDFTLNSQKETEFSRSGAGRFLVHPGVRGKKHFNRLSLAQPKGQYHSIS